MTYTFLSAAYANPQHTSAVAITVEAAAVALSEADTPEAWAAMLDAVTPLDYVPPLAPPAPTLADLQAQLAEIQAQIQALSNNGSTE